MNIKISKMYDSLVCFLIVWCTLQDFVLSIIYKITGSVILVTPLFYSKDILLFFLFFFALFKRRVNKKYFLLCIGYFFVVIFSVVIAIINANVTVSNILQNIRNVILLPCFCCIGMAIYDEQNMKEFLKSKYITLMIVSTVFGLCDYILDILIGTASFWRDSIGLTSYYAVIKQQGDKMINGLPGNFYGSYGKEFFSVKRMVGFWANPLTSAYTLLIPISILFVDVMLIKKVTKRNIFLLSSFLILVVGVYLTHTRAIILLFGFCALFYIFMYMNKRPLLFIVSVVAMSGALFFIDYDQIVKVLYDGSTYNHIFEVSNYITKNGFSIFGHGINYAGTSTATNVGTESTYLSLIGNIGLIGFSLYLILFFRPLRLVIKRGKEDPVLVSIIMCSIVFLITGFISEQLFAYTTIAPFYILLGFAYGVCLKKRNNLINGKMRIYK